jgi:hypothetical protein
LELFTSSLCVVADETKKSVWNRVGNRATLLRDFALLAVKNMFSLDRFLGHENV